MKKVIQRNGSVAVLMLAGLTAVQGAAGADAAELAALPVAVDAGQATAPAAAAAAAESASPVRDTLLELVVQYLDIAFVSEPRQSRTARLDVDRSPATVDQ